MSGDDVRLAVGSDFVRPRRVDERTSDDEFARHAVEDVEESVAIRHHDDFARAAGDRQIGEHRDFVRVPVVRVVRRELIMPLQHARIGIEREQRVGVQVVARPRLAVPIRIGISRSPVQQVERGIVRAAQPRRRAAALPDVSLPRVAAGLSRGRNRVEAPQPLARHRIVRVDESAVRVLAAGNPDDHFGLVFSGGPCPPVR